MLTDISNANKFNAQSFNLSIPKCPTVSEYVQSCAMPAMTLGEATFPTPFSDRKEPGDKILFSPISISFILDEELKAWREIYDWITALGAPQRFNQYKNFGTAAVGADSSVFSDGTLIFYTSQQAPFLKINIRDMFPIALSEVPISIIENTDPYVTATADFQFTTYDIEIL